MNYMVFFSISIIAKAVTGSQCYLIFEHDHVEMSFKWQTHYGFDLKRHGCIRKRSWDPLGLDISHIHQNLDCTHFCTKNIETEKESNLLLNSIENPQSAGDFVRFTCVIILRKPKSIISNNEQVFGKRSKCKQNVQCGSFGAKSSSYLELQCQSISVSVSVCSSPVFIDYGSTMRCCSHNSQVKMLRLR